MNKASELIEDVKGKIYQAVSMYTDNVNRKTTKPVAESFQLLDQLKELTEWTAFEDREPEENKLYNLKIPIWYEDKYDDLIRVKDYRYLTAKYFKRFDEWIDMFNGDKRIITKDTFYKELE